MTSSVNGNVIEAESNFHIEIEIGGGLAYEFHKNLPLPPSNSVVHMQVLLRPHERVKRSKAKALPGIEPGFQEIVGQNLE